MRKVNICYYFFDCWYKYSEYNLNTKVCVCYFILFFINALIYNAL